MHQHNPDKPPFNLQPYPPPPPYTNETSIVNALVSMFYLALTVAELSLQLGLLAVATVVNFLPGQQQLATDHSLRHNISLNPSDHITSPSPPPSPSTAAQPHLSHRTFRPLYLPIRHFLRLFPQTEAPDTEWFATERVQSEDVDMYDEHGEYNHGLHLEDLTQDDLDMDEAEATAVTQSTISPTDTSENISSVTSSPTISLDRDSTFLPSSGELICDNCRVHRDHYDNLHPEMATISNIGWHCSPPSGSRVWFVVSVGRNIGVFDSW